MVTWTVSANDYRHGGMESGIIEAWNAAYDTATALVSDGVCDTITLDVDGSVTRIHPANSGNEGNVAATLEILARSRLDVVNVLSAPDDEDG